MRRTGWGLGGGGAGYEKFLQISQWYWDIPILGDNKKGIFLASFNWLVSRTKNWQEKGFFVEHVFFPSLWALLTQTPLNMIFFKKSNWITFEIRWHSNFKSSENAYQWFQRKTLDKWATDRVFHEPLISWVQKHQLKK